MPLPPVHVLVVDDLADMADSTVDLLTLWGFDATACYSGATALACARARRPAAVLLDLAMPRMDGFEFARAFRALDGCGTVPLVALSGSEDRAGARAAGIDHYLLKPAAPEGLRSLLVLLTRVTVVASARRPGMRWKPRRRRSLSGRAGPGRA